MLYPVSCHAQALAAVHGDTAQISHVAGSAADTQGARSFGIYSGMLYGPAPLTDQQPCFVFHDKEQLPPFFGL